MVVSVYAASAVGLVDLIAKGYGLLTYAFIVLLIIARAHDRRLEVSPVRAGSDCAMRDASTWAWRAAPARA